MIASAQITVSDLNDPIQQGTAPSQPIEGMLWLDTSLSPMQLKRWNGTEWEVVNDPENIRVGGRNILLNSAKNFPRPYRIATTDFPTKQTNVEVEEWGCTDAFRITGTQSGDSTIVAIFNYESHGMSVPARTIIGQQHTNSIYIKNNHAAKTIAVRPNAVDVPATNVLPGQAIRWHYSFTATTSAYHQIQIYVKASGDDFDITYWHPQIEFGNVVSEWSPAPEDTLADAIAGISIGGRNLIWRTLTPGTSIGTRPCINGRNGITNGELTMSAGTLSVAEHGITVTNTDARQTVVRFGQSSSSTPDGNMMGLFAGGTYTFSCDAELKLLGGTKTSATTRTMFVIRYAKDGDTSYTIGTVADGLAYVINTYTEDTKGTVVTKRVEFTFTLPPDATSLIFTLHNDDATAAHYAAGDYISLRNMKLERGTKATDWTPAPEDNQADVLAVMAYAQSIEAQVDGKIDMWFYAVAPSASVPPENGWSAQDKADHVNDLYYNTATGYCYRYTVSGSTYSWTQVRDKDIEIAWSAASNAQDTADSKRRVFTTDTLPDPPYDAGDMWAQGASGDILVCVFAKAAGQQHAYADWAQASKYTDDTAVNNLQIGGRNLLLNSAKNFPRAYQNATMAKTSNVSVPEWSCNDAMRISGASGSSQIFATINAVSHGLALYGDNSDVTKNGQYYTYSMYLKNNHATNSVRVRMNGIGRGNVTIEPGAVLRWSDTDAGNGTSIIQIHMSTPAAGDNYDVTFWHPMIEYGNKVTDWSPAPEDTTAEIDAIESYVDTIQTQLDGKIDTWFYAVAPSASVPPENGWSAEDKANHVDDLYYNTATGYCYRYTASGSTYSWVRIKDSDITDAASTAAHAQDTADNKRRVFTSQPTTPYDEGDMWAGGSTGDLKVCVQGRQTGSFNAADWALASKYTSTLVHAPASTALTEIRTANCIRVLARCPLRSTALRSLIQTHE